MCRHDQVDAHVATRLALTRAMPRLTCRAVACSNTATLPSTRSSLCRSSNLRNDHQPHSRSGFRSSEAEQTTPAWFKEHDGASPRDDNRQVLLHQRPGAAPPFFAHRYRLVYSIVENVKEITEIQHPAVRAVLQWNGSSKGSKSITTVICRRAPGWAQLVVHRWPDQRAESSGWAAEPRRRSSPTMRFTSSSASCASPSDRRIRSRLPSEVQPDRVPAWWVLRFAADHPPTRTARRAREPSDAVLLRHLPLLIRHRTDQGR
mgnify:CR=1 FL=1